MSVTQNKNLLVLAVVFVGGLAAAEQPAEKPAEKPAEAAPASKPAVPQRNPLLGEEAAERVKKFPPSFSKAQEGVEIGIVIASDRKAFHEGERVPLELVIRNASQKTLVVQHSLYPPETPPTVIDAGGKQLSIEEILLLGANRRYRDILKPNEVAVYQHMGLGLGEEPNPPETFWHPFLKNADAVPGKYRLSQQARVTVREGGWDGGGTAFFAPTGEVKFEIEPADPKKGAEKPAEKPADKPAEKPAEAAAAPQKDPLLGKEAAEHVKKFPPSFAKPQEGVEVGIAIASDRKAFHEGERVPLEFVIRNVSQKTLHVQHGLYPPHTPPTVIGGDGKQILIDEIFLSGAIRGYQNTLKPDEVAVYRHMGLGLGEKPNPPGTFWHPFLKNPAAGKFRLSQPVRVTVREEGQETGTALNTATGEVAFEIAPGSEEGRRKTGGEAVVVKRQKRQLTH